MIHKNTFKLKTFVLISSIFLAVLTVLIMFLFNDYIKYFLALPIFIIWLDTVIWLKEYYCRENRNPKNKRI